MSPIIYSRCSLGHHPLMRHMCTAAIFFFMLIAAHGGPCSHALAMGERSKLHLALLALEGASCKRLNGLRRLAWEIEKRTSIDVALVPITIKLSDPALFNYPFLYVCGDKTFDLPSSGDLERLSAFLMAGGMMLIDSAETKPGGDFDRSVRRLITALFPKHPFQKLKPNHVLFKSFYLLDKHIGRVAVHADLEAIEQSDRLMVIYSQNDLSGAWSRDKFGQWEFAVYPGGDQQREIAIRWGINIVMYALCLDYKTDQVHIPALLKRRRWKISP